MRESGRRGRYGRGKGEEIAVRRVVVDRLRRTSGPDAQLGHFVDKIVVGPGSSEEGRVPRPMRRARRLRTLEVARLDERGLRGRDGSRKVKVRLFFEGRGEGLAGVEQRCEFVRDDATAHRVREFAFARRRRDVGGTDRRRECRRTGERRVFELAELEGNEDSNGSTFPECRSDIEASSHATNDRVADRHAESSSIREGVPAGVGSLSVRSTLRDA